ncbi:flagellar filament capping protein FliD [Vreelandella zhaodongensis]|uniref:Flagellar hook-associated protein 2 n=1 Tax=Vreelandella zhaodongensis TaxID=1176240 RepID=A0ABX2SPW1_VREZH|nr:flagellar filament capping protein FliD [Halomonas zhaodongensis]NYS44048.1 flagellar filament capping protein FliD [Halomonas zhaodongensis]
MATITSLGVGSGLDLTGLLEQLRGAERQKLVPITQQKTQQEAKISGYGQLKSAMSQFQTSVNKLNDPKLYQSLSTEIRGGNAIKATASSEATAGRYDVEVTQLARAGSLATNSIQGDNALTQGLTEAGASLTLTFGKDADNNDITRTIALTEGSSLEDIRDQINDFDFEDGPKVNASIVNDGSGYRLALNSATTGEEGSINGMDFTGLAGGVALASDPDTAYEGRNAKLKVNGIAITSETNSVQGAIAGVTLNLEKVTEADSPNTVVVARNTLAVREAVEGFVKGYNDLKAKIGELTAFNGGGDAAGGLIGDRAVRSIESQLRSALVGNVPGGDISRLSDIGIELKKDGTLELDSTKMSDAVANNQDAVAAFFAGDSDKAGMGGQVSEVLDRVLSENGALGSAKRSAEGRVESLDSRFERMETSIERTVERYRKQFTQLDMMMSQMNSTSGYLFQQLDMMNSQMANRK